MREKGFSLVEVLIAALIFVLLGLAIFTCINYSHKNVISSRNAEVAINLCQESMEMIKKVPFDRVPCPATFTPTWYQKGIASYQGYPIGNFPPVFYPASYDSCTSPDPAECTCLLHDHKDLLVSIGARGTQTINGTKTIFIHWVDDPEIFTVDGRPILTSEDYKRIKVNIAWLEGGIKRQRETVTYISKK